MSKDDKKVKRWVRVDVIEIVEEGFDPDAPHQVDYRTNYKSFVERKNGKTEDREYGPKDRPPFLELSDILVNVIVSTLVDEVDDVALSMNLAQSLAHKIVHAVAESCDVSIVKSVEQLREMLRKAGAPPHVVAQMESSIKERTETEAKPDIMEGFENAQLTKEQQEALALTLNSHAYLKTGKS